MKAPWELPNQPLDVVRFDPTGISETLLITTIASMAMSAAAGITQYMGQNAQAKAVEAQNAANVQNIQQNQRNEMAQAQQQEQYKNDEAAQKVQDSSMQERAASATMQTSAGENGVSGTSVGALQQEYEQRKNDFATDVEYNRSADVNALQWQMQGFDTQAQSQLNSLRAPVYPSLIGSALSIGGSSLDAYNKYSYQGAMLKKNSNASLSDT